MKDKKSMLVAVLVVSTLLGSVGQLFFKIGLDASSLPYLAAFILAGIVSYGVATLIYLYVLGRSHLSWAYGFVGFSYIFTTLLAFFVLDESVGMERWIGVLVIAAGTALIGMS
jgi:uncharacterized membrane protein